MSAEAQFEIAIVGGALVGAAAACALAGERVALLSQEPRPPPAGEADGFDSRVYAISPGNAAFLARLGAWSAIPERHLTPVHAMRVHGDDGESVIEFDAYRGGVAELAWIVEDRRVQEALWRGLDAQERLTLLARAPIREIQIGEREARLALRDGRRLSARLVIGADGARSLVRGQAGIGSAGSEYGQTAVVANFACARPHRNIAWQWFQGVAKAGAILALLPMAGDHVSMVWSLPGAQAQRLMDLDRESLAREVAVASAHALGELSLVTPARGFGLRRLAAARMVAPRVALAGDAAHVLHPLAGQGANLGLQDARVLAEVLSARAPGRDPGELRLLRRYERARAEPVLAMRAAVHGLQRLFGSPAPAVARLRNAGLNFADRLPVLKNLLMRHAMG
ncbi:MAG: FAD-dependent monooxygenase [Burkholderiales bacterium]|nr:FAD-dependent monooxygenase [Burkholderiales bacterium]